MKSGNLLLGVLAGVAAGALLGILLAPDKGSGTRKKISEKGDDLTEGLKERFNEFLESVSGKLEKVKGEISGNSGKSTVNHGKAIKEVKPPIA